GLDTADLASRAGRSQFAAKAPARARPRGQLTAAQRAWLDAERSAGGGRRR
ncbi:crossover junction endodeoxyribonuclease RuvC, partial [Micrococcus luteus]|nr:crossover junction endodeoxyribonuclease RuvC [Micrococcus luteus]